MLILTRLPGEKIIINDGAIEIVVISKRGSEVGLGIVADSTVSVDREEVYYRKIRQKQQRAA